MSIFNIIFLLFFSSCINHQKPVYSILAENIGTYSLDTTYTLHIPNKEVKVIYREYNNGRWNKISIKEGNTIKEINSPFEDYNYSYEISSKNDLSLNNNFIVIHRIDGGKVNTGDSTFIHERYSCAVLNISSGCLGIPMPEIDCSGEWSQEEDDVWIINEEKQIKVGLFNDFNLLFDNILSQSKRRDYSLLKSNFSTKGKIIEFLDCIPIYEPTLSKYNDIGFFLEQAKMYKEAIYILELVIKKFPSRTVAYINIGDAYWGLEKKDEAKQAYLTYIKQMKQAGKETKIPQRIMEIVQ